MRRSLLAVLLWAACAWPQGWVRTESQECDSGRDKTCVDLLAAAMGRGGVEERKAAIAKLSDQEALAKIAEDGRHPAVRVAAIRKLTDAFKLDLIASDGWFCGSIRRCTFDSRMRKTAEERLKELASAGIEAIGKTNRSGCAREDRLERSQPLRANGGDREGNQSGPASEARLRQPPA